MSGFRIHYFTECSCCDQERSRTEKFNHYADAECRIEEMLSNAVASDDVKFAEIRLMEGKSLLDTWIVDGTVIHNVISEEDIFFDNNGEEAA